MFDKILKGIQIILIPLLCGLIGLILMAFAFVLPTDRITSHVKESVSMLKRETNYFSITPSIKGTQFDNYTEAIYLNEALVNNKNADILECILSGYRFAPSENTGGPIEKLIKVVENSEYDVLSADSKRFFNGYEVVVKPLLIITNYSGIRQINMLTGLLLSNILIWLLFSKGFQLYIPAVIVSFLFIHPLTMALNMTFFGYYICLIIPCFIILQLQKETLKRYGWLLFGITGAFTFYYNMNYIQLLSFGIPLLFYYLVMGVPNKPIYLLKEIAYYFSIWMVCYVGMMFFKWIAYALLIDKSIFLQMKSHFLLRVGVDKGSRWSAIKINYETGFKSNWWLFLEILYIGGSIAYWIRKKKVFSISISEIMLLIIMILIPTLRYYILSNHVIVHHWVTYRLLLIPILAFNLLVAKISGDNGRDNL